MDCIFTRLSNLISVYVLALFLCGSYNYLTSYLFFTPTSWEVSDFKISPRQVTLHPHFRTDQVNFGLKGQLDFRNNFHWGARQTFAWLSAEYETPTRPRNEVVIWDGIAKDPSRAIMNVTKTKYQLKDYGKGYLKKTDLNMKLRFQFQPKAGFFHIRDLPLEQIVRAKEGPS
eukprot:Protomagalhaensia_wolfi_Nauph_80__3808@NODE_3859_length_692_cov_1073_560490_g3051_i0_p1_GENE_NODE_3859_length_692_cov_1073_560490_g3051_i0NODE_3859_length_692_cov_1073_560490_g3051_i0_p1_ORF_typecomplete_len172_score12_25SPC22/PF04573_12/2_1e27_NODE_3859_length_692_cov_1073_560490_g3051_i044559